MAHPDWAVKYRRPGTELRRITETRYCLYECSSVYDKEKKRARKITGKYLGSITEEGGFKESRKRVLERELSTPGDSIIFESKQIAKFSPMAMVRQLARARVVRVDNEWRAAELTKKEMQLAEAVGVHIT